MPDRRRAPRPLAARRVAVAPLLGLALLAAAAAPAAAEGGGVAVEATLDGRPLADSDDRDPAPLDPRAEPLLEVVVTNDGDRPAVVRTVRLEGTALGLTFFAYEATVALEVPAGGTASTALRLDLGSLDGQASGLLPGSVEVLDADRTSLASTAAVWDVEGRVTSVLGLFALALATLTGAAATGALLDLRRSRLHPDRWRRGLRFATPGAGTGLVVVFTLAALRWFAPAPTTWVPLLAAGAAVGFGLGYLTPAPDAVVAAEEPEELEVEAVLTATGSPT